MDQFLGSMPSAHSLRLELDCKYGEKRIQNGCHFFKKISFFDVPISAETLSQLA